MFASALESIVEGSQSGSKSASIGFAVRGPCRTAWQVFFKSKLKVAAGILHVLNLEFYRRDSAFVLECRLLNEARAEQGRRINELGPISREAQHSFLTSRSHQKYRRRWNSTFLLQPRSGKGVRAEHRAMPRVAWHSHSDRLKVSSQGGFTFGLAPELPKVATADQRQEANK